MLCSKFTCKGRPIIARLKDTEKRHYTHMVRTSMVRKIVPYTYGMYHTRMVHTIRVRYKIRIWYRTAALPKRATIHCDTIQVLPDITRDFSSDNYLNILRESGAKWSSF